MKTTKRNLISLIFGILIISIIGFLIFKFIILIINKVDMLNVNLIVAILAGTFTIIGFYLTRFFEKKKLIEEQIRERKLPIYEEFIDFIFKVFENIQDKTKDKISDEDMQKFFWKIF